MKISLNWLKRYLPIQKSPQELSEVFPMLGFEVEEITLSGLPPLQNVVVGEVKSRIQHPNADRLGVCEVQVGPNPNDIKQIVCGATNYKVGDRVPVALVGAILPGDFQIKKSKLRGVDSDGMLCSAKELGLGSDASGLLILQNHPPIGTPINELFTDNDVIFDLSVTPNRGDCQSHLGLARELAAYYNIPLTYPPIPDFPFTNTPSSPNLQSPNCPLYTTCPIQNIKIAPSPEWLKKDLEAIGLRPINNIVDITNWIMMDSGQPLHAFDAAKIKGSKLIVRQAKENEKITTLDEKSRTLDNSMLIIADEEKPLAIAGIMGSQNSEVDDSTTDIILESAYFNPASIRHTARKLNLSTDSSYRFIRDIDPQNTLNSAKKAIALILEIAGGKLSAPGTSLGTPPRSTREIQIDPNFVRERCGFDIPNEIIANIYQRLGFTINTNTIPWQITIPSFRPDITRPIDLVEEFVRVYGTNQIPESRVHFQACNRNDDPIATFNHSATDYLVGQHFTECNHYTLRKEEEIQTLFGPTYTQYCALENPLTADHTHLRPSLLPGLLDAVNWNQRNGNSTDKLFETGRVLQILHNKENNQPQPVEVLSIAFVIALENPHQRTWLTRESTDFYKVKNLILEIASLANIPENTLQSLDFKNLTESPQSSLWQPNQSATTASLSTNKFQINAGLINLKLSKSWDIQGPLLAAEIFIMPELLITHNPTPRFQHYSSFPASTKDLALVMDKDYPAEHARKKLNTLAKASTANKFSIENVSIFDVYQGQGLPENKKSIAFSITFKADDRTLKDEEIMTAFEQIQQKIKEDNHFSIRT